MNPSAMWGHLKNMTWLRTDVQTISTMCVCRHLGFYQKAWLDSTLTASLQRCLRSLLGQNQRYRRIQRPKQQSNSRESWIVFLHDRVIRCKLDVVLINPCCVWYMPPYWEQMKYKQVGQISWFSTCIVPWYDYLNRAILLRNLEVNETEVWKSRLSAPRAVLGSSRQLFARRQTSQWSSVR